MRYVDAEPFTTQAEEAERFGIDAVRVATEEDGRRGEQQVYLGAVVISSYDKVVVPFFEKVFRSNTNCSSVQTVADDSRYTVGVLQTDADLMDNESGESSPNSRSNTTWKVSHLLHRSIRAADVLLGNASSLTAPK